MPNFQSSAKMGLTKSLYPYTIVFKSEPEAVLKLTRNEIFFISFNVFDIFSQWTYGLYNNDFWKNVIQQTKLKYHLLFRLAPSHLELPCN